MATIYAIDGFDYYNSINATNPRDLSARWSNVGIFHAWRAGRFDGQAFGTTSNSSSANTDARRIFTAGTTRAVGISMTYDETPTADRTFLELCNGTATQVRLALNTSKQIKIINGAGTTLHTTTATLALSTWYSIEMKVVHHTSAGSVVLKIDGVVIANLTSVNTTNNVAVDIDSARIWARGDLSAVALTGHRIDDFYAADDFPGFTTGPRVYTLEPQAEVNVQFIPSSGTDNAAMLEVPMNEGTWNLSSANGALDTDEFSVAPLNSDALEVMAVNLECGLRGDSSGTACTFSAIIWSGSEATLGTGVSVPDTGEKRAFLGPLNTDPDDGGAWTIERIEALRIGYRATALGATEKIRVQSAALEVLMGAPIPPPTGGEVTQAMVLALDETEADLQISQLALLVLAAPAPNIYITQAPVLVLEATPAQIRITQTVVMALVPGPSIARAADASFNCAVSDAQCWKITRTDGVVVAFTTHDEDIVHDGVTYKRCDSLKASAFSGTAISGQATGDVQVAGILSDAGISEADLYAGRYDDAIVIVRLVDWKTGDSRQLARGIVTRSIQRESSYTITALSGGARLEQQPLLDVYSPLCRWELGDARCQVDIAALEVAGAVTGVTGPNVVTYQHRRMFADAARVEPVETYRNGRLTWTSGLNTGLTFEVKNIVSSIVTLWQPCPFGIAIGDAYTLRPGCGKTKSDCISRYNNYDNFGGFPDLPGNDAINLTPDRTE